MAMRGDDVIGIQQEPQSGGLLFLKTEAKSRAVLTGAVMAKPELRMFPLCSLFRYCKK